MAARIRKQKFVPHTNEVRKPHNTPTMQFRAPGVTNGTNTRNRHKERLQAVPALTDTDIERIGKHSPNIGNDPDTGIVMVGHRAHLAAYYK